jgi:hypothetical protein
MQSGSEWRHGEAYCFRLFFPWNGLRDAGMVSTPERVRALFIISRLFTPFPRNKPPSSRCARPFSGAIGQRNSPVRHSTARPPGHDRKLIPVIGTAPR